MSFPDFSSGAVWVSLLTLTFLEIVLGVDNIIFLSIISARLPLGQQNRARSIGLTLAMAMRIALLFGLVWIVGMTRPLFRIDLPGLHGDVTGQGLILFLGGIFLLYKATSEIHHKLDTPRDADDPHPERKPNSLGAAIAQIAVINLVFSFDSILTAIGITKDLAIMIIAIVVSVLIMMLFAGPVSRFVNRHPTVQMLGLAFLLLIGFTLIAEAAHLGHFIDGEIPKGYLYFAIFFSLLVEMLNLRMMRGRSEPVELHGPGKTAKEMGMLGRDDRRKS